MAQCLINISSDWSPQSPHEAGSDRDWCNGQPVEARAASRRLDQSQARSQKHGPMGSQYSEGAPGPKQNGAPAQQLLTVTIDNRL